MDCQLRYIPDTVMVGRVTHVAKSVLQYTNTDRQWNVLGSDKRRVYTFGIHEGEWEIYEPSRKDEYLRTPLG